MPDRKDGDPGDRGSVTLGLYVNLSVVGGRAAGRAGVESKRLRKNANSLVSTPVHRSESPARDLNKVK